MIESLHQKTVSPNQSNGVAMVQAAVADDVFHALSNATRRKVLEQLSVGPATVSELAAPFDMKLPSFVQHLAVLE